MKPTHTVPARKRLKAAEEPRCRRVDGEMMIDYLNKCHSWSGGFMWKYKTNSADSDYYRWREDGKNMYRMDLTALPGLLRLSHNLFCAKHAPLKLSPCPCLFHLLSDAHPSLQMC